MNSNILSPYTQISGLLETISTPARIQILLALGSNEACVCHLENRLGLRQAYLSQQLMALRETGIISSRRDGKFIYYRLAKPEVLQIVSIAAQAAGLEDASLRPVPAAETRIPCECPKCKE